MKKLFKNLLFTSMLLISSFIFINSVDAASGTISVSSGSNKIVVGKTFNVSISVSSGSPIGSYGYTLNYDSSKVKLVSGDEREAEVASDDSTYKMTKNYTFKAIASGSPLITVKNYQAYAFDLSEMSLSVSGKTFKTITQAELEASYSKNNNLSSLSVEGYEITPVFGKDTLEYSLELDSTVEKIVINAKAEDSKSNITGSGEVPVIEGSNVLNVVVTAENGSAKTYILNVNVKELNPIYVTINGKKYSLVKKTSALTQPTTFTPKTIKIDDVEIPAFYSEITKYTIVGLKDEKGTISYFIYNKSKNSYTPYNEYTFNSLKLCILEANDSLFPKEYQKTKVTINNKKVDAYKLNSSSKYSLVYAINIETGKKNIYMYEEEEQTMQIYNSSEIDSLKKNYNFIIIALGSILLLILFINLISLLKKSKKKKRKVKNNNNIENNENLEINQEEVFEQDQTPIEVEVNKEIDEKKEDTKKIDLTLETEVLKDEKKDKKKEKKKKKEKQKKEKKKSLDEELNEHL